jgi:hypothetical protein
MLDWRAMLFCKSPSGAHRKRLKRAACGVAIALVGALCLPMSEASSGSIDAIQPKPYIRSIMSKSQALCLIRLYGKESAFNRYAIGNLEGKTQAYGIPQLKNPEVGLMNAVEQVNAGIDYIEYRYGSPCRAYAHWLKKGWH